MRYIGILLLMLIFFNGNAQVEVGGSKMVVVGTASKTVEFDLLRIRFNFDVKDKTQKAVSQKLDDQNNKLLGMLGNFGVSESDLKVVSVGYGEDYDYTSEKPKRTGFTANKTLEMVLKYSPSAFTELMDSIYALNLRDLRMNIELQMSPNQKANIDRDLIKLALTDAQQSARTIAESLGLNLESINTIVYNDATAEKAASVQPIQKRLDVTKDGGSISIPNDQTLASRSITITWNIRKK